MQIANELICCEIVEHSMQPHLRLFPVVVKEIKGRLRFYKNESFLV